MNVTLDESEITTMFAMAGEGIAFAHPQMKLARQITCHPPAANTVAGSHAHFSQLHQVVDMLGACIEVATKSLLAAHCSPSEKLESWQMPWC